MAEPTRRTLLAAMGGTPATAATEENLAWAFDFPASEGGTLALAAFKRRVLLVADTASFSGTSTRC